MEGGEKCIEEKKYKKHRSEMWKVERVVKMTLVCDRNYIWMCFRKVPYNVVLKHWHPTPVLLPLDEQAYYPSRVLRMRKN